MTGKKKKKVSEVHPHCQSLPVDVNGFGEPSLYQTCLKQSTAPKQKKPVCSTDYKSNAARNFTHNTPICHVVLGPTHSPQEQSTGRRDNGTKNMKYTLKIYFESTVLQLEHQGAPTDLDSLNVN